MLNDYILDAGMNNGDDTHYYLAKGFEVVAIEANPELCTLAENRFSTEIAAGRLRILNAAVSELCGPLKFFINEDNSHWSSLDIEWAGRDTSLTRAVMVRGITLQEVMRTYGEPRYAKIDIEGGDRFALMQIRDSAFRPQYLSVEDCRFGLDYVQILREANYKRFKLSNQAEVPDNPDQSLEYQFSLGASGLFGEELPGKWVEADEFIDLYSRIVRDRNTLQRLADQHIWWDIHCAR